MNSTRGMKGLRPRAAFRGQASGAIELVVAVIILVASMGLAFMVLQNTQTAQCTDKLKSQMRNLEAVLLDVALGSPATSREVDIQMSTCGGTSIEAIRLVYYDQQSYCGKCPATGGGCWIIEPLSYDAEQKQYNIVRDATTCINMPGRITLEQDDACQQDLVSTTLEGDAGCPPGAKQTNIEKCGLPPSLSSSDAGRVATMGKKLGETQYKTRVTKDFATAAGDPVLRVCFLSKSAST